MSLSQLCENPCAPTVGGSASKLRAVLARVTLVTNLRAGASVNQGQTELSHTICHYVRHPHLSPQKQQAMHTVSQLGPASLEAGTGTHTHMHADDTTKE